MKAVAKLPATVDTVFIFHSYQNFKISQQFYRFLINELFVA